MTVPKPPDDPKQMFQIAYDGVEGEVVINDFGVQEAIKIRSGLVEKAVRDAAVIELEKLGYTIIPPDNEEQ